MGKNSYIEKNIYDNILKDMEKFVLYYESKDEKIPIMDLVRSILLSSKKYTDEIMNLHEIHHISDNDKQCMESYFDVIKEYNLDKYEKKNVSDKKSIGTPIFGIKSKDNDKVDKYYEYWHSKIAKPILIQRNTDNTYEHYKVVGHLKEYLDKTGITQSFICKKTGIAKSTLSSILSNEKSISLENAWKISKALDVNLEELFEFTERNTEEKALYDFIRGNQEE